MSRYHYKDFDDYIKSNKNLFKDHKLTATKLNNTDLIIDWSKPSSGEGSMRITYIGGYLSINGDYGSASFTWHNPNNTIEWMSKCNIGYFMSKCISSEKQENGIHMMEWDQDECIETVESYISEKDDCDIKPNDDSWKMHTESACDWNSYLSKYGENEFGDSWYETYPNAGLVLHSRVYIWIHALQEISKHLDEDAEYISAQVKFNDLDSELLKQDGELDWTINSNNGYIKLKIIKED